MRRRTQSSRIKNAGGIGAGRKRHVRGYFPGGVCTKSVGCQKFGPTHGEHKVRMSWQSRKHSHIFGEHPRIEGIFRHKRHRSGDIVCKDAGELRRSRTRSACSQHPVPHKCMARQPSTFCLLESTMTKHAFLIALFFLLLLAAPAEAQRPLCGGHFITWTGGAPAPSRAPASADRRPDARYDPTHEDGQQPTIEEPAGLNRELWDALVFDEWQRAYRDYSEQTIVLAREAVPDINICIQSPDTSTTGELLEPFSNADWWREHIHRWTGINWNGEIRIAACTDGHRDGWINVRAGRPGEVRGVAHTVTERARHPHRVGRWISSDIIWNPGLILALIGESQGGEDPRARAGPRARVLACAAWFRLRHDFTFFGGFLPRRRK